MRKMKISRKIVAFVLAATCVVSGGMLAKAEAAPSAPAAASASASAVININSVRFYNQFTFDWNAVPGAVEYSGYYTNLTQGKQQYFTVTGTSLADADIWLSMDSSDDIWVAVSAKDADGNQIGYGQQHFTGMYPAAATYASASAVININSVRFYNQFTFDWNAVPGAVEYSGYYTNLTQGTQKYFTVTGTSLSDADIWLAMDSSDDIWVAVSAKDADGNTVGYGQQHFAGMYPVA